MFRRTKTVASVMESFRNTITDLQGIIELNIARNVVFTERRTALDEQIAITTTEITQARGVEGRLNDLVFGPDPSTECSGGCPK